MLLRGRAASQQPAYYRPSWPDYRAGKGCGGSGLATAGAAGRRVPAGRMLSYGGSGVARRAVEEGPEPLTLPFFASLCRRLAWRRRGGVVAGCPGRLGWKSWGRRRGPRSASLRPCGSVPRRSITSLVIPQRGAPSFRLNICAGRGRGSGASGRIRPFSRPKCPTPTPRAPSGRLGRAGCRRSGRGQARVDRGARWKVVHDDDTCNELGGWGDDFNVWEGVRDGKVHFDRVAKVRYYRDTRGPFSFGSGRMKPSSSRNNCYAFSAFRRR